MPGESQLSPHFPLTHWGLALGGLRAGVVASPAVIHVREQHEATPEQHVWPLARACSGYNQGHTRSSKGWNLARFAVGVRLALAQWDSQVSAGAPVEVVAVTAGLATGLASASLRRLPGRAGVVVRQRT